MSRSCCFHWVEARSGLRYGPIARIERERELSNASLQTSEIWETGQGRLSQLYSQLPHFVGKKRLELQVKQHSKLAGDADDAGTRPTKIPKTLEVSGER